MTTQEKSLAIGTFMGIKPHKVSEALYSYSDFPWYSTNRDTPEKVMHDFAGYAKYHEKWDWIIPVVKKIVDINILVNSPSFGYSEQDQVDSASLLLVINDALTDLSIQGLFDAVYEYIQWYQSII